MLDQLRLSSPSAQDPAYGGVVITPDDDTDLTIWSRAVFVGGAGDLVVTMADGIDLTFAGLSGGTFLPIRVSRVKEATTATNIVVLY